MSAGWEHVAVSYGGTVAALAVANNHQLYAATSVGVFRSSDGGVSWSLPGTAPTVPFASALGVSPQFATDRTVFACGADGLYRSSDAGGSWQRVLVGGQMFSVSVARDGLTVLVATEDDGVLRSEDRGKSWTGANAGLLDLTVLSLALSPGFETDRTAFAGAASGLYRTRNGGRSWRAVDLDLEDEPAVQCIGVSPEFTSDRRVYVGTETNGLLRSSDGGSTWTACGFAGVSALAFRGAHVVAAATDSSIAVSEDGGETWRESTPSRPALALAFVDDTLLAGLHRGGVMRDGHDSNGGLSARLDTSLVYSPDGRLFIGGLEDGVRVSADGGSTWADCNAGLVDATVHTLASSATKVWAATPSGVFANDASGWHSHVAEGPALMIAALSREVVAALGGGRLVRSADEGANWHPLAAPWSEAEVVALTVGRDKTIFAATSDANGVTLWRALGGGTFTRWLVDASANSSRVALAAVDADNVVVGVGHRVFSPLRNTQEVRRRERRPLWRSADLGVEVVGITALAASTAAVFAATNAGVFFSRDRGATFANWSDGLDRPRMVAVAVSPDDRRVFGLGLGGTVWARDSE